MAELDELQALAANIAAQAQDLEERINAYRDTKVVPLPNGWYQAGDVVTAVITGEPPTEPAPTPTPEPEGERVTTTTDLAALTQSRPAGHVFRLAKGTYRFHDIEPKDRMQFLGDETDTVIINGEGRENAFHGLAQGVVIRRMTFEGFDNLGGTKAQQQAPIRGTRALWHTTPGTPQAKGWLIEDVVARHNVAGGLFLGHDFIVRNVEAHHNGVVGISGSMGYAGGALLEDVEVHHNGTAAAQGVFANGGGVKFGSSGTAAKPIIFRRVKTHHQRIGLWGDIGCRNFIIEDIDAWDHETSAVVYEISEGFKMTGGRVVRSNGWENWRGNFNSAAVNIAESANALTEGVLFKDCLSGAGVRQNKRPHRPAEDFLDNYDFINTQARNIVYRNCRHEGVTNVGLSIGTTGSGIADLGSVRYEGNPYTNPGGMKFWWNGQQQTYDQWTAAGRR